MLSEMRDQLIDQIDGANDCGGIANIESAEEAGRPRRIDARHLLRNP